jgi:hypothetical protein
MKKAGESWLIFSDPWSHAYFNLFDISRSGEYCSWQFGVIDEFLTTFFPKTVSEACFLVFQFSLSWYRNIEHSPLYQKFIYYVRHMLSHQRFSRFEFAEGM